MKTLWNGQRLNWVYRILAGILAVAAIVTVPFVALGAKADNNLFDLVVGALCYSYLVLVFACVSVRGKSPTGVIPWK